MSIYLDHDALTPVGTSSGGAPMEQTPAASGLPAHRSAPGASLATVSRGVATVVTAGAALLKTALVSILGAGAIMLTVEAVAPVEWRPSTLLGTFGGREQAAVILTSLEARRAEVAMQQEEAARAQQEIIVIQANNERVTQAYAALFQRGNTMAQAWAQATSQALLLETQNRIRALEGQAQNSATKDSWAMAADAFTWIGAALGVKVPDFGEPLRSSARNDRESMTAEIVANYKRQSAIIASSLRDWSQGLPDPAELIAAKARIDQLYPTPRLPAPPAPRS